METVCPNVVIIISPRSTQQHASHSTTDWSAVWALKPADRRVSIFCIVSAKQFPIMLDDGRRHLICLADTLNSLLNILMKVRNTFQHTSKCLWNKLPTCKRAHSQASMWSLTKAPAPAEAWLLLRVFSPRLLDKSRPSFSKTQVLDDHDCRCQNSAMTSFFGTFSPSFQSSALAKAGPPMAALNFQVTRAFLLQFDLS